MAHVVLFGGGLVLRRLEGFILALRLVVARRVGDVDAEDGLQQSRQLRVNDKGGELRVVRGRRAVEGVLQTERDDDFVDERIAETRNLPEGAGRKRSAVRTNNGGAAAAERLAANRREFLDRFVNRDEFRTRYTGVSNADYVNALFTNAGVDPATEAATRDALVAGLNNGTETRASVLPKVADTRAVFNALYNRAFVLMEYFGNLRRNPDPEGFQFWLNKLNSVSIAGEDVRNQQVALARIRRAEMVEALIDSTEYRQRFGQP